jgi:transposase
MVYDATNTYLYGKKCSLGKLGHDKEGIPVFRQTFNGNIADARTFEDLITTFRRNDMQSGALFFRPGHCFMAECC